MLHSTTACLVHVYLIKPAASLNSCLVKSYSFCVWIVARPLTSSSYPFHRSMAKRKKPPPDGAADADGATPRVRL